MPVPSQGHYGSKVPAVTVTVFKYRNKIGKIVVKLVVATPDDQHFARSCRYWLVTKTNYRIRLVIYKRICP